MYIGLPTLKLPEGGLLGLRFNPAPGWPPPPPGFVPPPHWQPDPSWPPAPPGWQIWVDDGVPDPRQPNDPPAWADHGPAATNGGHPAASTGAFPAEPNGVQARPGAFGDDPADAPWADDFTTGHGDPPPWAADLTGPQTAALRRTSTRAYPPGSTGPQARYDPDDMFSPDDPFTRQDPGPGAPPGGPDGRRTGTPGKVNFFAVASLILGVLGVTVIGALGGIVLGVLALRQIRRTMERGRGMAIAGIVLSVLWLVLIGAYFALHSTSGSKSPSPPPASTGHGSSPTPTPSSVASHAPLSTNVFSLKPGQCFQNPPASQTVLGVTYVTVVTCSTPHNAQAFVQFTATGTSYPGAAALRRQADTGCHARVQKNVRTSKITNSMTLHYLFPLKSSWTSGHKTITCMIVAAKPNLKTSLLRTHAAH